VLLPALLLAACGAPNSQFLLQLAPPACEEGFERPVDAPILRLDDFTTMPGMDRTAVFLARDNVVQPSTIWYWEGNPAEVMAQAVNDRLDCEGPYRVTWPYFGTVDHAAVLRARVREFHISRGESPVFTVRLTAQLWAPDHERLLAEKIFSSSAEASELTPQATAQAASRAVADVTREISTWLEATRDLVSQ
jgi:ABC-type uncharacterized transport system auxiliary subunit